MRSSIHTDMCSSIHKDMHTESYIVFMYARVIGLRLRKAYTLRGTYTLRGIGMKAASFFVLRQNCFKFFFFMNASTFIYTRVILLKSCAHKHTEDKLAFTHADGDHM